jgi:hypothetical protein
VKRDIKPPYHYYPWREPIPDLPVLSVNEAVETLLNPEWTRRVIRGRTIANLREIFEAVISRQPDYRDFYQMVFWQTVIKEPDLRDLDMPFSLIFQESYFLDNLVLNNARFPSLSMEGYYICGVLNIVEVRGQPTITITNAQIDDVRIHGGEVGGIYGRAAHLGGLSIANCAVKGGVTLHHRSEVRDVLAIEGVNITGALDISETELYQVARARDVRCDRLAVTGSAVRREFIVERSQTKELDLHESSLDGLVDLRGLQFDRMDVTGIRGEGVIRLEEVQVRSRRRSWWPLSKYDTPSKVAGDGGSDKPGIAKAAEQLLSLRERFHRVPSMAAQEDYCAYRLMEAGRALAERPLQRLMQFVAKCCLGYLLLPGRILATMFAAMVVFGAIYAALTLSSPGRLVDASQGTPLPIGPAPVLSVLADCLYFSVITFVTLSYGIVPIGIARPFAMIEAILGLVLVSLFTASLVRRALRW